MRLVAFSHQRLTALDCRKQEIEVVIKAPARREDDDRVGTIERQPGLGTHASDERGSLGRGDRREDLRRPVAHDMDTRKSPSLGQRVYHGGRHTQVHVGISAEQALVPADQTGEQMPIAQSQRQQAGQVVPVHLASRHGCRYQAVSGSQLVRVGLGGKLAAVGCTLAGVAEARRLLRLSETRLVLGFGGYASGPLVIAARTLGLPAAIHEANVWPGLANRLLGRIASRVYLNDDAASRHFPAGRWLVTGWPVRQEVSALAHEPRRPAVGDRPARVLICSGSRGGAFFGQRVPAVLERLSANGMRIEARHQSAEADPGPISDAYRRAGVPAGVMAFIDDMRDAYLWADVAITRAGAGTIAELALAGLPALLVPLADAAEDHQAPNAKACASAGAGFWVREGAWNAEDLAGRLSKLLTDPAAWEAASAGARQRAAPDAADRVVDDCEAIMRGRW